MKRIAGTGMNQLELQANLQLNDFAAQDLNKSPVLPYADESFDVVTCVVSVDYLIRPLEVFREVHAHARAHTHTHTHTHTPTLTRTPSLHM